MDPKHGLFKQFFLISQSLRWVGKSHYSVVNMVCSGFVGLIGIQTALILCSLSVEIQDDVKMSHVKANSSVVMQIL